jgi:hypothetical protein
VEKITIKQYSADSVIEISAPKDPRFFSSHQLFKTGCLISKVEERLTYSGSNGYAVFSSTESSCLFDQGLDCQILETGAEGWKKGKLKIVLEFIPEESEEIQSSQEEQPESPLDEIRQMVDE